MTVGELRAALDGLRDDLVVIIERPEWGEYSPLCRCEAAHYAAREITLPDWPEWKHDAHTVNAVLLEPHD